MKLYVRSSNHMFFNNTSVEDPFKVAVSEFLARHGPTYWGVDKRDQLLEPDIFKGFLCPRDAQREYSRLVFNLGRYFKFRRKCMTVVLTRMDEKEQAVVPRTLNKSKKRSTIHRESKDVEEGEVGLCEPSGASKRHWPLLPSRAITFPSLLNSEGLNQQGRKPIPSRKRIAPIHRHVDVIASDKSDKKTKAS